MVPLSENFFVADLASIINVPIILIMSNKIGYYKSYYNDILFKYKI